MCTNLLRKKKHMSKGIIPLFNSLFSCQDILSTLFMARNPTNEQIPQYEHKYIILIAQKPYHCLRKKKYITKDIIVSNWVGCHHM